MQFYYIHQCRNYNGCKDRNRQIADKPGCAKKNQGHCNCCHNRHCLCLSFILLIHRCSGYTSVHRTAPYTCRRDISHRTGKDFLILIDLISVLHCEIILWQKCLRHYNCRDHQTSSQSLSQINSHKPEMDQFRKSFSHRIKKDHTIFIYMEYSGCRHSGCHDNNCHWKFRYHFSCHTKQYQRTCTKYHWQPVNLFTGLCNMSDKFRKFPGSGFPA